MLPMSRNTTYAAGISQVKAGDLNELQDVACGFLDDFYKLDTGLWTASATGAGSTLSSTPHLVSLLTGVVNGNTATLAGTKTFGFLTYLPRFRTRVAWSTALTNRTDSIGLQTAFSNEVLAFYRDTSVSTQIKLLVLGGAGVETFTTGFSPVIDTFYILTAWLVDTGHVSWTIHSGDGATLLASGTSTLASAVTDSTHPFGMTYLLTNLSGATHTMVVDAVSIFPGRKP